MTGEAGADLITKPVDFKAAPETSRQINFTPLSEFEKPMITEPPKYEESTTSVSPQDEELTNRLMAQIMGKEKPQETISQIKPQEKKSPGFFAKIIERLKNTLRNLFR